MGEYPSMASDSNFISLKIKSTEVTSGIVMEWCLYLMVSVNLTVFVYLVTTLKHR